MWKRAACVVAILGALSTAACAGGRTRKAPLLTHDIHSWSNPGVVRVTHLNLDLRVIFEQQIIQGTAILSVQSDGEGATPLILDSKALHIDEAEISVDGTKYLKTSFSVEAGNKILGTPLRVDIAADTKFVRIRYSTDPKAKALQWLEPEQTADGKYPFLYTQSEAIHARSWIPLQDSPGARVTYEARVHVPSGMKAVMSAKATNDCSNPDDCRFDMEQPIPPYLIALAVGDLAFESTGPRTGVWAEPAIVHKAAIEFSDMEKMLEAAEKLYGPYRWGRYDVLVLPPSFPFGGMENPRMTFATPTVIASDQSLVSLVAHELAHSWSGNLVTNATWSDYWLNEGFTVYIERRILEELYGRERADMEAVLGYQELLSEIQSHPPADQILHINLEGRDPDDGSTQIPYEKGALFLKQLELAFGRDRFDAYLKQYFDHFAFQSITTAQSIEFMRANLLDGKPARANEADPKGAASEPELAAWIYQPGLPPNAHVPESEAFKKVDAAIADWTTGKPIHTSRWSTQEWLRFLRGLPQSLTGAQMPALDAVWHFTQTGNDEILFQWLLMSVRNSYEPANARLEEFLTTVGRRKFVKPLYEALDSKRATAIYERARPLYHPITQASVDAVIAAKSKGQGSASLPDSPR